MNTRTASWATVIGVLVLSITLLTGIAAASVGEDHKVTICHVPPGNPDNAQTIEVDEASGSGHRNHPGDYEGPCLPPVTTTTSTTVPVTTSTSTTVETTTTTVPETTTTTVPATTTTTVPVTTTVPETTTTVPASTTVPTTSTVPPTSTTTTQPGPDIDYPATTFNVPPPEVLGATGYQGGALAVTGSTYNIVLVLLVASTVMLVGLLVMLVRTVLAERSQRKKDTTDHG